MSDSAFRPLQLALAAALLLAPAAASAQSAPPPVNARAAVPNNNVISANPFLWMAEYFNVEYERKHTDTSTFGVSASMVGFDGIDYRNLQGFYRYYPQQTSLAGFYVGGRLGVHHVSEDFGVTGNALGLGIEIGYSWLLGTERNFGISVGAGATRLVGDSSAFIPTLRLVNLGWSF